MTMKVHVPFLRRRTPLQRLADRYGSDKGSVKHGYTRVYEHYFRDLRDRALTVVEIGLQRPVGRRKHGTDAPSLRMWRSYFPRARLIGFDLQAFGSVAIDNCVVLQGDQGVRADIEKIIDASPGGIDVVIDDGSHASQHQQANFARLFPHVRPNGLYIIEDLQSQPEGIEDERVPKTRAVFRRFLGGLPLESPLWPDGEAARLTALVADAELFDSLARGNPVRSADALLVVRKRATVP